jgi:branched-chain amino acid transport system substrate-binding protein
MNRTIKTGLAAAIVVGALSLAACSSPGGGGGSTGGGGKKLTIGLASILAGPAATTGVAMDCGIKAYLDGVNDAGGADGYTFDYLERDTQFDPAKASAISREFISANTFAVLTAGSASIEAVTTTFKSRGTAVFGLGDGGLFTPPKYDGAFGMNPDYRREAAGGAEFIRKTLKEKSASVAYLNTGVGQPAGDAFPKYFDAHGGKTAAVVPIEATVTDFAPYAQKLKDAGAPVVYAVALDTQVAALQKASTAIGYSPKWVTWSVAYTPSYLDIAGGLADGVYVSQFTLPSTDTSVAGAADFAKKIKANCPDYLTSTAAAQGWSVGALIEKGVKSAAAKGPVTPTSFVKALNGADLKNIGLMPQLTYDKTTHSGVTKVAYSQIENGGLKPVTSFTELPPRP